MIQTEVGVNAWVLHYDKDIYGPDPEVFRPERWLEGEKTSIMDSMMFAVSQLVSEGISLLNNTHAVWRWFPNLYWQKYQPAGTDQGGAADCPQIRHGD